MSNTCNGTTRQGRPCTQPVATAGSNCGRCVPPPSADGTDRADTVDDEFDSDACFDEKNYLTAIAPGWVRRAWNELSVGRTAWDRNMFSNLLYEQVNSRFSPDEAVELSEGMGDAYTRDLHEWAQDNIDEVDAVLSDVGIESTYRQLAQYLQQSAISYHYDMVTEYMKKEGDHDVSRRFHRIETSDGEEVWRIRDGEPAWVHDMVEDARSSDYPNDWDINMVVEVSEWINDNGTDEDGRYLVAEDLADHDATRWVAPGRWALMDNLLGEYGHRYSWNNLVTGAQQRRIERMAGAILEEYPAEQSN